MALRQALLAAIAGGSLAAGPVLAQSVPPAAGPAASVAGNPTNSASLTHSALKATTFKIATTGTNVALLSYAAGGIIGGVGLSAFMLGSSWVLFTANDYLWDKYAPQASKQTASEEFDAGADVWHNTLKYLTYKPVIASVKYASLYAYTGSAGVTAVFGTASILTNTVVFYINNVAWDMYDWYSAVAATKAATR